MESLVFKTKKDLFSDSTQIPYYPPWKVYRLGHGGMSKNKKDIKILEELQRYGVISYIYPW